jgi:SNW domain-containing protein 1
LSSDGTPAYDAVIKQNLPSSKIVHSTPSALIGVSNTTEAPSRPDEKQVAETTRRTKEALEKLMLSRSSQAQPDLAAEAAKKKSEFIKYTPASGGQTRVIKMVEAALDPMEPPKFKHKKLPRGPPSPPPPILHSPTRKVTKEEQAEWYVPPSISNWKNLHGYTIPLDKRLAADGRGLAEHTISDGFSKLSEALFIADKHAREEVQLRAKMQSEALETQKLEKEEKLRLLAQQARLERAGLQRSQDSDRGSTPSRSPSPESPKRHSPREDRRSSPDIAKRQERHRDEIRAERSRQRERDLRKKPTKERDISEKIALGIAQPTTNSETLYDARLFNRTEGLNNPLATSDDAYNVYDKPLFNQSRSAIYRPTRGNKEDFGGVDVAGVERMIKPTKGFIGTEGDARHDGPVQFEKEGAASDPFGLDVFLKSARDGAKRSREEEAEEPRKRQL